MLRLSPPRHQRFIQAELLEANYGGGEANVAVSLANYGLRSAFVTRLPDNPIGHAAANHLRRFGVGISSILWGGDRIGIYFAENGASQRPSMVVYDRARSAVSEIKASMIPWKDIFGDAGWFHFTGITPALGDGPAEAVMEALQQAKEMGLTVSCDLNYRRKLWSTDKAAAVMTPLMKYVDIVVGNEEDAENVFGIRAGESSVAGGWLDEKGYRSLLQELQKRFNFQLAAVTLRKSYSATENGWSAMLYDGEQIYRSREYNITIVDRIGAGDSFCGALIYALLKKMPPQQAIDFAAAASCLKHTISGDFNLVSLEEVENLAGGDDSGRVRR